MLLTILMVFMMAVPTMSMAVQESGGDAGSSQGNVYNGQAGILIRGMVNRAVVTENVIEDVAESSSVAEATIYHINISKDTQHVIWEICQSNLFSYELVLAIYQIEGNKNTQFTSIKSDIEKLVYYRDYWTEQGFPDEIVFSLLLLSRQRGIEGCIVFMKANDAIELDDYVQKVTKYKYYLEQL